MATKKMKDGRWYSSFYYTDWTGERKRKKKEGFKTKREAEEWERIYLEHKSDDPTITFRTLYGHYKDDRKINVKQTTYINRIFPINKHILPYFEDKIISEITVNDVRKWQNLIKEKDYSQSYIRALNNYLVTILNFGVKFYGLKSNVASKVDLMGKRVKSKTFWTLEEYKEFEKHVKDKELAIVVKILFYTGMRVGELLALTEKDIENNVIHVNKTMSKIDGVLKPTTPKTECSNRDIAINEGLYNDIQNYLKCIYHETYPFCIGRYRLQYQFNKAIREANLKKIRIHDLRHSHASLLISLNVAPLAISKRLGHESIKTTMDTYGHLYPKNDDNIANGLESLY